jgi:hypothetical protein
MFSSFRLIWAETFQYLIFIYAFILPCIHARRTICRRWSGREGGAERANYVLFLTELTEALDLPRPEPADSRSTYRFEYPVEGDFGQKLRIDLYRQNCFILEAKQSRLAVNPFRRYTKSEAVVQEDLFGNPVSPAGGPRRVRWAADMSAAFRQARDYAYRLNPEVDRPPFLITCDVGRTFEFYADFSGQGRAYRPFAHKPTGRRVIELDHLVEPETQAFFRRVWEDPRSLDPALERSRVTRTIADHLAELSRSLERQGHPSQEVALFLSRLLFALFAKDVGLLPKDKVDRLLRECHESPVSFAAQASALFGAMDVGAFSPALGENLRRFNGAFFKNSRAFPLRKEDIGVLLEAAQADWREVEPAIFGTLLEHALDPGERGRLGAHYTPRPYVERLVQATIMSPLRSDWDTARAAAAALVAEGELDGARSELHSFHEQLTQMRVLDPACGTGNFLYVALELMHGLEGEVIDAREELGAFRAHDEEQASTGTKIGVDPRQFLGLELNPRAAIIAELVLWIGYLQANYRRHGAEEARVPVLEDYGTINPAECRRRQRDVSVDAVLEHDGLVNGGGGETYPNPRQPAWPEVHFIIGNPPFIGGKDIRAELGDAYAEALWLAYPDMNDSADFVMYWWNRAADLLTRKNTMLRRFGFVTTNSITQVFQRRTVARWLSGTNPNKNPLSLVFAVDDHPWTKATKDSAAVRIAMTVAKAGAHEGELAIVRRVAKLDSDQPQIELLSVRGIINGDLTVGVDVTRAVLLHANDGLCSPGMKLHGAGFIVSLDEATRLGLGRHDRPGLETHVRPYRNGRDLAGRSRDKWVIDLFGLDERKLRRLYPEVYDHVTRTVRFDYDKAGQPNVDSNGRRTGREWNNRQTYRDNWWLFGEPRSELRPALANLTRYIVTIETSKHRTFQFLENTIIPDNMLVAIASDDAAHLAILSSRLHTEWATAAGGWLGVGNDPRYSKSRCFDPFPFPELTASARANLAELGEGLDMHRKSRLAEYPDLTLTRLYNAIEALRAHDRAPSCRPTAEQTADAERGAVRAMMAWHDDIDRETLTAYGWSDLLSNDLAFDVQGALGRLVALNAERRMEEARGQVRWLRAHYQAPRSRAKAAGIDDRQADIEDLLPPVGRIPWPREPRPQLMLIRGALAEAGAPVSARALAGHFKGRKAAAEVRRLLDVLVGLGEARATGDGYTLLRVA